MARALVDDSDRMNVSGLGGRDRVLSRRRPRGGGDGRPGGDVLRDSELGLDAFRFSIAWPRVLPDGRTVNAAGLDFYDHSFAFYRDFIALQRSGPAA